MSTSQAEKLTTCALGVHERVHTAVEYIRAVGPSTGRDVCLALRAHGVNRNTAFKTITEAMKRGRLRRTGEPGAYLYELCQFPMFTPDGAAWAGSDEQGR